METDFDLRLDIRKLYRRGAVFDRKSRDVLSIMSCIHSDTLRKSMHAFMLPTFIRETLAEAVEIYLILLKILLPTILIVKVLEEFGGVVWLGNLLSPLMELLGLPDALGIVWAVTMMANIVTGMIVFASVAAEHSLSVSQMTVLGTLMLLAHSLSVEGAICTTCRSTMANDAYVTYRRRYSAWFFNPRLLYFYR